MPPPCALARSKLHALPALPPPAAGVLRTAEDRFETLPGYRYAPKYADVADAEKVRGAVWRMTSVSTTTHEMQAGLKNESACRGAGGAAFGGTDLLVQPFSSLGRARASRLEAAARLECENTHIRDEKRDAWRTVGIARRKARRGRSVQELRHVSSGWKLSGPVCTCVGFATASDGPVRMHAR